MNAQMEKFARDELARRVPLLNFRAQANFKRIFGVGRDGERRSIDEALSMSIEDVVMEIAPEDLSSTLDLVERTEKKESEQ